jgi:hypothetical protein
MLHRSALLAFLSTALLLPATAQAADPVVAGPATDGSSVTARITHGQLCLTPQLPPAVDQGDVADSSSGRACVRLPAFGPTSFQDGVGGYARHGGGGLDEGMTGTGIAAVELRKGGRVLAHAATQASPLAQLPGVRFYAIYVTESAHEIVFLDAAGTVVRAADPGTDPTLPGPTQLPEAARRTIVSGRTAHGGVRWRLRSFTQSPIVSTPLAPERRVTSTCVTFGYSIPRGGGGGESGTCDSTGREGEQVLPFVGTACGPVGVYVGALVRSGVTRVAAVLGDGRTRAIPLHAAGSGLHAGAVTLGPDLAVRRIVATSASGRSYTVLHTLMPPASSNDCSEGSGESLGVALITYSRGLPDTTLGAGAHRLVVADQGDDLCFAVDRAPRAPGECTAPPVDAGAAQLLSQPAADGRFVAALVTADVASVRVVLDDGSTAVIPTTPVRDYSGRYAQRVRAVATTIAGPHRVLAYTMLDAAGHAVSQRWDGPDRPRLRVVRTLGHVPGVAGALTFARAIAPRTLYAVATTTCLSFGPPSVDDASGDACLSDYADIGYVRSSCTTRRTVVVLPVAHRADHVSVRLASGREVPGHTYALPAGAHARAVGIVVLGPHDAARTLIRRGASPKRVALRLPAAADQCGFRDWPDFEDYGD